MATVYNFSYTGNEQSVTLKPGKYKFECWGSSGGINNSSWHTDAKGGYSKGEIILKKQTTLYIYVGESGFASSSTSNNTKSGFNGGGKGYLNQQVMGTYYSMYGGGATDIRLVGGAWDKEQGLLSRIIVAGGGGGTYYPYTGGVGGGLEGGTGYSANDRHRPGGTQYQGGIGHVSTENGSFGKGCSVKDSIGEGGGGGWFGGAGMNGVGAAGGGSGYILTKDSYKPAGYTPTSEYYFDNATMESGGNTAGAYGYAKITLLQPLPFLTVSSYNSTQAIFKADHTDPTLLTKIEVFIDDRLKETITTDLTLEKTINYTLEDNALHTLKIVVTDSANATAEKVVSISKNIMPLGDDASLQDIASKISEMKEGLKSGKRSIVNVLALKDIDASLNNTFVELSEKVKDYFDSADSFFQEANKGKELIATAIGSPAIKENTFAELSNIITQFKKDIGKKIGSNINSQFSEIIKYISNFVKVSYIQSATNCFGYAYSSSSLGHGTSGTDGNGADTLFLEHVFGGDGYCEVVSSVSRGSKGYAVWLNIKHTRNGTVVFEKRIASQDQSTNKFLHDLFVMKGDKISIWYGNNGYNTETYSYLAESKLMGNIKFEI
ncbi:glycine rich domain-containing protein [Clostridioides sp. ES-S-0190-01]|uniref:glycine rich domain-containing protein n=1 Tax=Clostridioides sp. ES-S-0190-01 TaxID=2770787 RepID=UPI001D10F128